MRRTVKIFGLILLYFLACAKSCDNEEKFDARTEQEKVNAVTDTIRKVFGADTLSSASLHSYMEAAKQKFYDYNDYLDIVADTSKAGSFRDKTREMITGLFLPGTEPPKPARPFSLFHVTEKEGFHPVSDSVYSGRIGFTFVAPGQPVFSDVIKKDSAVISVFLVKRYKNFGKERLRVWDVFLGKIE